MKQVLKRLLLLLMAAISCCPSLIALPTSNKDVIEILKRLDRELDRRNEYIYHRQSSIDSLRKLHLTDPKNLKLMQQLGELYTSFNNDSALAVYYRAIQIAKEQKQDSLATHFRIARASLLPLAGFFGEALDEFNLINPDSLSIPERIDYYAKQRQMYSFMSSYYHRFQDYAKKYSTLTLKAQRKLLDLLPHGDTDYEVNLGEYYFLTGEHEFAEATIKQLLTKISDNNRHYGRATHILADIAEERKQPDIAAYYLGLSAISDTKQATREVTSLQELGQLMFDYDDIDRAHHYLYTALRNAVECNAGTRMIQVSEAVPLIESVHQRELGISRTRIFIVISLMGITLLMLIIALFVLRVKMKQMKQLENHFREANATKEEYISQFLNLCSIYMDKLKQFCNIANRKISTGKVDDLYQLTKSGKFIENQSKDFYEIFDNAFIHIYPGFVENVNALLRPDQQITLSDGELLNTDLRILAFMRLGISDSGRIAQILNYSVNTIYAYRNKLKNKAINRETFESDIQSLQA